MKEKCFHLPQTNTAAAATAAAAAVLGISSPDANVTIRFANFNATCLEAGPPEANLKLFFAKQNVEIIRYYFEIIKKYFENNKILIFFK